MDKEFLLLEKLHELLKHEEMKNDELLILEVACFSILLQSKIVVLQSDFTLLTSGSIKYFLACPRLGIQ